MAQVFSCEFCLFLRTPFLIEHLGWLLLQIYRSEVISVVVFLNYYSFKPFRILNFAMVEWFCHVKCFSKVYLILFLFSYKHNIFIIIFLS